MRFENTNNTNYSENFLLKGNLGWYEVGKKRNNKTRKN
jgi:hypothetical protein